MKDLLTAILAKPAARFLSTGKTQFTSIYLPETRDLILSKLNDIIRKNKNPMLGAMAPMAAGMLGEAIEKLRTSELPEILDDVSIVICNESVTMDNGEPGRALVAHVFSRETGRQMATFLLTDIKLSYEKT